MIPLPFTFHRVEMQFAKTLTANFRQRGYPLTYEQFMILYALWIEDGVKQKTIALLMGKETVSVTKLLDVLETKGFVIRVSGNDDRRIKKVYLREAGRSLQKQLLPVFEETYRKVFGSLTEGEEQKIQESLQKIPAGF